MECNRCPVKPILFAFTQTNLENSLGRMKTKQIIAAVNNLKVHMKGICESCRTMPSKTNELVGELREAWNSRYEELVKSIRNDTAGLMPAVEKLREAFQAVCLTCSRVSNDDNPSNHGQTFVSLDSGNCQADSGRAKSTATDDNIVQSRADWLWLKKSPDVDASSYGCDPASRLIRDEETTSAEELAASTTTMLPPAIEDRLRTEFSNFVELDIIDKMLLSCIISGMNVAEFAKMLWFPYSLVDPVTRQVKAVTKQAMHARWKNICRRFPVFMAVAAKSLKDDPAGAKKLKEFIEDPNGDEMDDRFANGKMKASYVKAAARAKEIERKMAEREKAKREAAVKKMLAERKKSKQANKKRDTVWFPQREADCLPGLFG